jgi:hypothetical protein
VAPQILISELILLFYLFSYFWFFADPTAARRMLPTHYLTISGSLPSAAGKRLTPFLCLKGSLFTFQLVLWCKPADSLAHKQQKNKSAGREHGAWPDFLNQLIQLYCLTVEGSEEMCTSLLS